MPRRLLDRCQPDSIREFRAAARRRYDDALSLAAAGRRTGVKAAYFALIGLGETQVITWTGDLQPAIKKGQGMGILWPNQGAGHNVRAWAELLVAARALSAATTFSPAFALDVQRCGQRIEHLWRETLRYRKNDAYPYEMKQVREAAEWLLINSHLL